CTERYYDRPPVRLPVVIRADVKRPDVVERCVGLAALFRVSRDGDRVAVRVHPPAALTLVALGIPVDRLHPLVPRGDEEARAGRALSLVVERSVGIAGER